MTVSDWDAVLERLTETRRALANVDTQPALEAPADAAECLRDSRGFADEALRFLAEADRRIRIGRTVAANARCGHPPGCCEACCPSLPGSTGTGAGCKGCRPDWDESDPLAALWVDP